jgi:hypothetical protein
MVRFSPEMVTPMSSTNSITVTVSGANGNTYTTGVPENIGTDTPPIYAAFPDVVTVINNSVADESFAAVNFDGSSPPPPPPTGKAGYVVDTVSGSSLTVPSDYSAVFDLATGPTTITARI